MRIICLLGFFLFEFSAHAGVVRTLRMNNRKMETINLSLGKSTVLRFRELPKKIVVGNNNYFNIEFIGNDVTIQPQAPVTSNLFIYGEYHVYGLILKVSQRSNYDDLVNVRWKLSYQKRFSQKPRRKIKKKAIQSSHLSLENGLNIIVLTPKVSPIGENTYILDLKLQNTSNSIISTKDLFINLTRRKRPLISQSIIYKNDEISPEKETLARIFVKLKKKKGFTLNVSFAGKNAKVIIPGRSL